MAPNDAQALVTGKSDRSVGARPTGLSARRLAYDVLHAVLEKRHPLDDTIERHPGFDALPEHDRAFARNLAATTLRRLGQIDAALEVWLSQPLAEASSPTRTLLRLGVAQVLFLRTPAHAAVHTTVALADMRRSAAPRSLINAVLRRATREGAGVIAAQDELALNTPRWLWSSWSQTYGEAVCRDIARAHLNNPPLHLTARSQAEALTIALGGRCLPTGTVCLEGRVSIKSLTGYAEGAWWVQDAAAALPIRLLGDVRGKHVIDLCAAPGGKTAQLAASGANVTAVDVSAPRLQRLCGNLKRLQLGAEMVQADAFEWRPERPADAVLIDAPCSASGTIRRHPDIPWLKSADDVAALAIRQRHLLEAAIGMVKQGGLIVYCVCSLQLQEGSEVVDAVLSNSARVRRSEVAPNEMANTANFVTPDGALRTLPCHWREHGGLDGFYAARLIKT